MPVSLAEPELFIPYVFEADFALNLLPLLEADMKRLDFLPNALKLYAPVRRSPRRCGSSTPTSCRSSQTLP